MKPRIGLVAALLVVVAFAVSACGGEDESSTQTAADQDGQTLTTVTFGHSSTNVSAVLTLGIKQGFFRREGIDLQLKPSANAAAAVAQLLNGQLDLTVGGVDAAISSAARGVPVKVIAGQLVDVKSDQGYVYDTLAGPDSGISSWKDLVGKTVAVNSLSCCWEFWTRYAVEQDGGDPNAVKFVQLPFPDQIGAAEKNQVDAVTTTQPFTTVIRKMGWQSLGGPATIALGPENGGAAVTLGSTKWIDAHADVAKNLVRALQTSADYANAHPDEMRSEIVEVTGAPAPVIAQMPLPHYTAAVNQTTVEKEADLLVKYGVLDKAPAFGDVVWSGAELAGQ